MTKYQWKDCSTNVLECQGVEYDQALDLKSRTRDDGQGAHERPNEIVALPFRATHFRRVKAPDPHQSGQADATFRLNGRVWKPALRYC